MDPLSRRVIKNLKKTHPLDPNFTPLTDALTKNAILEASNSTAIGPDGLTTLHLKHHGPQGIAYLTKLLNHSNNKANIPAIWRKANIIPITKPGKPADQSSGYHPISLLSPVGKILERLLLPFIKDLPCSPTQHGYKEAQSTVTALILIVTKVAVGSDRLGDLGHFQGL
jgi:hypothetical protein